MHDKNNIRPYIFCLKEKWNEVGRNKGRENMIQTHIYNYKYTRTDVSSSESIHVVKHLQTVIPKPL